jgi:hypothetical protein
MTILIATLNKFGDLVCPNDCNTNIIRPINAHYVAGYGRCERCDREFELTQAEIDKFNEGLKK